LNGNRNYNEEYWQKKTFAPCSFLYYVAFNRKVNHLLHHNLFFDTDLKRMQKKFMIPKYCQSNLCFTVIFRAKQMILFVRSKEVGFFLIPVAVDLEDNEEIHEKYSVDSR
jgi:phytoene desaturase